MKSLKKLLIGLFALSALSLMFVSCPREPEENVEVASVTFDPSSGNNVSYGDVITLTSETSDAEIWWSTTELNSSNFTDGANDTKVTVSEDFDRNLTIYAIAVYTSSSGKNFFSQVSSANYTIVGPKTPKIILTNKDLDEEYGIYSDKTSITLTAEEGVEIYYSKTQFQKEDYASQEKYSAALTFTGTVGETLSLYTVSVIPSETEGGEVQISNVKPYTLTFCLRYLPLTGSVESSVESGNYEHDGNIDDAIATIGTSTSPKTFSSTIEVSGYVTMTNGKTSKGILFVQDKNDAIEIYGDKLDATKYSPGDFVSFTASKGQLFYGVPEVTNATNDTVTKDSTKSANVLYYTNLNGKTDFSGLETLKLCGIRANASNYTNDYAKINSNTSEEFSHFGYVTLWSNPKEIRFVSKYTKNADTISSDNVSTLKNAVDQVSISETIFEPSTKVSLSTLTQEAKIYYTINTELTTDNYTSSGTEYSDDDGIKDIPSRASTVYVYATKEGYEPYKTSFSVYCLDENQKLIKFEDYASSIETSNQTKKNSTINVLDSTGSTLVEIGLNCGTNTSNNPVYNSSEKGIRFFQKNQIVLKSSVPIESIKFNWTTTPKDSTFSSNVGTYDSTKTTWNGLGYDVTFTYSTGSAIKFTSVVITFSEKKFFGKDDEV